METVNEAYALVYQPATKECGHLTIIFAVSLILQHGPDNNLLLAQSKRKQKKKKY